MKAHQLPVPSDKSSAWRALFFIGVTLTLLYAPPAASADILMNPAALSARGIDMQLFSMVTFSYDGSVLLGIEKEKDVQKKQQGFGSKLRVFYWRNGLLARMDTIPLPTTAFEQLALSSDGKSAIAVGEGGSKFIYVDLTASQASVLWAHRRGVAGFRSELVAWWADNAFYMLGYLHDRADQMVYDGLVRLNLGSNGGDLFERALDTRPILRQLHALSFAVYIDAAEAFFGAMPRPGQVEIYAFQAGTLRKIDQVVAVGGIAAVRDRVLYAARFPNGSRDVVLRDVALNRVWHLGHDNLPFNYLFLAANGKTAIVTLMNFRGQTMSYYYAHEVDGFKQHALAKLQDVKPGTLRLAPNGRFFAFYGPMGLLYGSVP